MLRSLRSLFPFILAGLGFTLIALVMNMPLFEWQINDIATDLPPEVYINSSWTTKLGDSLESGSYNARDGAYIFHQLLVLKNGNYCSPEKLTSVVRRSRSDERLEQIALNVNQGVVLWLTGLTQTGQITIAALLLLCGIYIWWFTICYSRPISEAFIFTAVSVILLALLINIWRILVPDTGIFICRPLIHGTLTYDARLSKIHYETVIVLFVGIMLEVSALGMMLRQIRIAMSEQKTIG